LLLAIFKKKGAAEEVSLVKEISAGNQGALGELYDLYSGLLFNTIYKIVKRREDAEEVLQSIFLQVWEKAGTFDFSKGTVFSWLISISRNKAIDKIRSQGFRNERKNFDYIDEIRIDAKARYFVDIDAVTAGERTQLIMKALDDLPEEQKKVLEMAYFEGFTQAEISGRLNIPIGTVKTRTRQALTKLEKTLSSIN